MECPAEKMQKDENYKRIKELVERSQMPRHRMAA